MTPPKAAQTGPAKAGTAGKASAAKPVEIIEISDDEAPTPTPGQTDPPRIRIEAKREVALVTLSEEWVRMVEDPKVYEEESDE